MADGVLYYDAEGVERKQKAEVVVVACNGVGTPRLLLNSVSSHFPDGIANRSGLVGKNLMFHPYAMVMGLFDERLELLGARDDRGTPPFADLFRFSHGRINLFVRLLDPSQRHQTQRHAPSSTA